MKPRAIAALQTRLGLRFQQPHLLQQALTHSSFAREAGDAGGSAHADNEQMEFLGDAVLGLVAGEELIRRFPAMREGELSKLRAHLVSAPVLTRAATRLRLGGFLRLGRGEEMSGGRRKPALLADALEAVVAALYLEAGLPAARSFLLQHLLDPELRRLDGQPAAGGGLPVTDFKSELQEAVQGMGLPAPAYVLVGEEGPAHKRTFTVEARLPGLAGNGRKPRAWRGRGSSKKIAEQGAARRALRYLKQRQSGQSPPASGRTSRRKVTS
jgi:ribonuclease-3